MFKDYHLGVNSVFIPILFYIWLQCGIYRGKRLWCCFPSSGQNQFFKPPFNQNPEILIFAFLTKAKSKIQCRWREKRNGRAQTRGISAFFKDFSKMVYGEIEKLPEIIAGVKRCKRKSRVLCPVWIPKEIPDSQSHMLPFPPGTASLKSRKSSQPS